MLERDLQNKVADYLRLQYPNVLFHSDYGSGVKLTARQATIQKRQNGFRRGWPDLFIAQPVPRCIDGSWDYEYHGLFIELKKEGTRIRKKDKTWATDHIAEQADVLAELARKGYMAGFAVGWEEAKEMIDNYLVLMAKN